MLSSQHKQFEPPGWFTKTAPIAAIFFAPFKSASPLQEQASLVHLKRLSERSPHLDRFFVYFFTN
ncbi:MAG: hypothetical protein IGS39_15980 [Calothrix sp. C42_A2020_038]|nr:hypothetical protein [Calothrix sp. C42_A2020_038]